MKNLDIEEAKIREKGFQILENLESAGKEITAELFLEFLSHPSFYRSDVVRIVGNYCREDFVWIFGVALNDRSESCRARSVAGTCKNKFRHSTRNFKRCIFLECNRTTSSHR